MQSIADQLPTMRSPSENIPNSTNRASGVALYWQKDEAASEVLIKTKQSENSQIVKFSEKSSSSRQIGKSDDIVESTP